MEPHQSSSLFSSSQQLLKDLENLIFLNFMRNGNPWISVAKLSKLFHEKHNASLEYTVQAQGYPHSLRSFLQSSGCFSIYGTSVPQDFYITLLWVVIPNYNQHPKKLVHHEVKQPRKGNGNHPKMLKAKSAKEIPSRKVQRTLTSQPVLPPEIKSVDDLESVLVEIIKSLTINLPEQFTTVAALSKKFHDYYGRPIKSVMRSVCLDMKLINVLQTMPNLSIQEVDNEWQIKYDIHSIQKPGF